MPKSGPLHFLKHWIDSNDCAWTLPLPPWAPERERRVRGIRRHARAVIRSEWIADRGRLWLATTTLAWPAMALLKAWLSARSSRRQGRPGYFFRKAWLQLAHNLRISEQEGFPVGEGRAEGSVMLFITDGEHKRLMAHMARNSRPERYTEKVAFASFCSAHGLPTVPIVAESDGGAGKVRWLRELPSSDLFFKQAIGWGGSGGKILRQVAGEPGVWCTPEGVRVDRDSLAAFADTLYGGGPWLLQPRLQNAPEWAGFTPGALSTLRLVTGRVSPDGPVEILTGFMRFPRKGASVDNLSSGGLGADIDPASGRLGSVRGIHTHEGRWDRHPDTGEVLEGRILPRWEEVRALALRAHEPITEIATIGWDVTLPGPEPILVEANVQWGTMLDTPLGATRYPEVIESPAWAAQFSR